jgi:hypothetical protein
MRVAEYIGHVLVDKLYYVYKSGILLEVWIPILS